MLKKRLLIVLATLLLLTSHTVMALKESDLLKPHQAFNFTFKKLNSNLLSATWHIAEGYYLYKKKIKFTPDDNIKIKQIHMPSAVTLTDKTFGEVQVYRGDLRINIEIESTAQAAINSLLKIKYQGCADAGLCYMPINKKITLERESFVSNTIEDNNNSNNNSNNNNETKTTALEPTNTPPQSSEQDSIAAKFNSNNIFLTLISFWGFGLLLAFTPCVFPMIPILSGIIIGQKNISTRKAFVLSVTYVLAMASAYTLVGVLAGLFGTNLQIWFQNPWVLSAFAAIFVLLSLAMFGFYQLQMPSNMQVKLNSISNNQQSGSLISAAIMGFLSALIVGPCVTAPLIGALIYIGQTGDALLGGGALFAMSLGMGLPLIIIGSSAGKFLPNSGAWMDMVKSFFGVLMLAVAIWLLARILPALITQLLCAILILMSAIYLGALKQHTEKTSQWQLFSKGLGIILFIYAGLLFIGISTGQANFLQPLKAFSLNKNQTSSTTGVNFTKIKSITDLDTALQQAEQAGQYVMLDFYADWCISCQEMDALTFSDEKVSKKLQQTIVLKADVTANDEIDKALLQRFNLLGPPAVLFFSPNKKEQKAYRVVGYMPAEKFLKHVEQLFTAT